jgi:hypothetical protein
MLVVSARQPHAGQPQRYGKETGMIAFLQRLHALELRGRQGTRSTAIYGSRSKIWNGRSQGLVWGFLSSGSMMMKVRARVR